MFNSKLLVYQRVFKIQILSDVERRCFFRVILAQVSNQPSAITSGNGKSCNVVRTIITTHDWEWLYMVIPPMYGDDWGWFMIVLPTLSTARNLKKQFEDFPA